MFTQCLFIDLPLITRHGLASGEIKHLPSTMPTTVQPSNPGGICQGKSLWKLCERLINFAVVVVVVVLGRSSLTLYTSAEH